MIELLVTIAILDDMLQPALTKAKLKAKSISSLSDLRHLGLGMSLHTRGITTVSFPGIRCRRWQARPECAGWI